MVLISCEELEVVNPADPNYKLKAPIIERTTTHADTAIILTWQNTEEYTLEFQVNRKSGSSSYNPIATVSKDVLSYTDTSFSTDIAYNYVVLSKVSKNLSEDSNEMTVEVAFPEPSNLLLTTISDSEIQLSWTDNCDYEAGYFIERDSGAGYLQVSELEANSITYRDTSLNVNIDYLYRVAAYSYSNTSGWVVSPSINTSFPAPTNLTIIAINDTSAELSWIDNCSYEVGYYVERDSGLGFSPIADLAENTTSYTDSSMMINIDYLYRVAAYTTINTSNWVVSNSVNTSFPAPTNLTAFAISDTSVRLTWIDNCDFEYGYRLERSTGGGFSQIAEVAANITTYVDNGLNYETGYSYRVAGFTSSNISNWDNSTVVNIEFPAPTNLVAATLNDSQVQLSWVDNSSNEIGFKIERDAGSGFMEIRTVTTDVTEYTDTGLTFGQSYDYRVAAYTSINTSSWTTITAATEFPTPTNLSANSVNDSELLLTWTDNTAYEMGFKIERDAGSGFIEIGTATADVTEYTDTGLTFGQNYDYRVAAYTSINTSSWTTITAATEFPTPTNLTALATSDTEIELTWTDNCTFETGYRIERGAGSGFVEVGIVSSDVTEYTDTGLTVGVNYSYRVAAYTASNTSHYSATVTMSITEPMADYDGNVYQTVQIGNQVWMAENLKVAHYRDGTAITNVTDIVAWGALSTEAYCIYNNNANNEVDTYGSLYNWYAVTDGHNIAPEGWHVPTDAEWKELEMHLGMSQSEADGIGYRGTNEGCKLAGNADIWNSGALENDSEFSSSNFTALPGGYRSYVDGNYFMMGSEVLFFSSTEFSGDGAWSRKLRYSLPGIYRAGFYKRGAYAVRLLRD